MQRRVVGIRVDAQAQARHAADRVVQCPARRRQGAQVIRVGRHHGENDAAFCALARVVRRVDDGVTVVQPVHLQKFDRGAHVGPGHAELAGMRGGLQARLARERIGRCKQLRRAVDLAVVDADAEYLVTPVFDHPLHHLQRGLGRGLAVDGGNQPAGDAVVGVGVTQGGHHGVYRGRVGDVGLLRRARRVPEELGIPYVVGGSVLQVLVGDAVQVVRCAQQRGVERAQGLEHTDRFLAALVEHIHLGIGQRHRPRRRRGRACGAARQFLERGMAHGAEQMAMDLDLGHGLQELLQGGVGLQTGGRCGVGWCGHGADLRKARGGVRQARAARAKASSTTLRNKGSSARWATSALAGARRGTRHSTTVMPRVCLPCSSITRCAGRNTMPCGATSAAAAVGS